MLVGCTGSVATIKVHEVVSGIREEGHEVRIVATEKALHFLDKEKAGVDVLTDADEWDAWRVRGDPVLHIELRKWADILVICPLDANTMAKIANVIYPM